MRLITLCYLFILFFSVDNKVAAQDSTATKISFFENSLQYSRSRARIITYTTAGGYALSMSALYAAWYKRSKSESFHLFNDNREWMQMDKAGHVVTSYFVGKTFYDVMQWAGYSENKSIWIGGNVGLIFLSGVEVFDGFSSDWGFSSGDMLANMSGAGLFIAQQKLWNEQKLILKYSFHQTKYADIRPDVFGKNLNEQLLKDYNGQTYWLSANVSSFINNENNFPKWLNVAMGYGAEGMTGGFENIYDAPQFERYRQYYISLDVDLSRLPLKKGIAKTILSTINFIKIPFPALEYNSTGDVKFHPFYF